MAPKYTGSSVEKTNGLQNGLQVSVSARLSFHRSIAHDNRDCSRSPMAAFTPRWLWGTIGISAGTNVSD